MDGMLSQDEINALLTGMDAPSAGAAPEEPAAPTPEPAEEPAAPAAPPTGNSGPDESLLSEIEKDAIGEVANISMGSSATTL